MSYLSLHIREDRAAFFEKGGEQPIVFDRACRRWIVADGDQVVELLKNPRLLSPNITAALLQLQHRYSVELPNLIFAAKYIPLLNEGAAHVEMRRGMSRFLGGSRERLRDAGKGLVDRHFGPFERQEQVELIEDVLLPLVSATTSILLGVAGPSPYRPLRMTLIFDGWASLKSLLVAEAAIGEQRKAMTALVGPQMTEEAEGLLVALAILGTDSLLSTLADSIRVLVARNPDRRLDEIEYPAWPTETGVAIAERQVGEGFEYGGAHFQKGDWVRLFLHGVTDGSAGANRNLMFGVGPHACLGRHLSLDLWQIIVEKLASIRRRAEILEFRYRDNRVFAMPEIVRLRLH